VAADADAVDTAVTGAAVVSGRARGRGDAASAVVSCSAGAGLSTATAVAAAMAVSTAKETAAGRARGNSDVSGASASAGIASTARTAAKRHMALSPFDRGRGAAKVGRVGILSRLDDPAPDGTGPREIRVQMVTIAQPYGALQRKQLFGEPPQNV
jgi:hypothetical protein